MSDVQHPRLGPAVGEPRSAADAPAFTGAGLLARLGECTVAVIGCGGLGSNAAHCLVRAGIGGLILADFDRVEEENLNRQFFFRDQVGVPKTEALAENLRRIRPDVELVLVSERLTEANLLVAVRGADAIIEAVDTAETKAMIMNVCTEQLPGVPLAAASGLAGCGPADAIVTERLSENLWVIGDLTSDVRDGLPLVAPRVCVAAAAQAHAVVRVLLGLTEA